MLRNLLLAGLILASSACSGSEMPAVQEAHEVKEQVDQVADKLDGILDQVQPFQSAASVIVRSYCDSEWEGTRLCKRLLAVSDASQEAIEKAREAVEAYRQTSVGFDDTMRAVVSAAEKVQAFSLLARTITKSLA